MLRDDCTVAAAHLERVLSDDRAMISQLRLAPACTWLLKGLWYSGLRLGEAFALSWEPDAPIRVDMSGPSPLLKIDGEAWNSGFTEDYPVAPELRRLLDDLSASKRHGKVFRLTIQFAGSAGRIIDEIGGAREGWCAPTNALVPVLLGGGLAYDGQEGHPRLDS